MSSTATPRPCRYAVGDVVLVLETLFGKPGMPREWVTGTVTAVEARGELPSGALLFDVFTVSEQGPKCTIVGPRGLKGIRPTA